MRIQKNEIGIDKVYTKLLKLYSIAYIKRYITYYIDLKLEGEFNSDGVKIDLELNFENNEDNQPNEVRLVKIYMLKILNQKGKDIDQYPLDSKYLGFLKGFIDNYKEDKQNENGNDNKQKDYCIFNLRQKYLNLNLNIDKQIEEVKNNEQNLNNLIDNFYSLLSNQFMPKYLIEKKDFKIDENNIKIWKKIDESNKNISPELKLFYDNLLSTGFYFKLKSKLPADYEFNDEKIHIILFILKFVLISIINSKKNLFSSLLITIN
jgi:hypothetical protein